MVKRDRSAERFGRWSGKGRGVPAILAPRWPSRATGTLGGRPSSVSKCWRVAAHGKSEPVSAPKATRRLRRALSRSERTERRRREGFALSRPRRVNFVCRTPDAGRAQRARAYRFVRSVQRASVAMSDVVAQLAQCAPSRPSCALVIHHRGHNVDFLLEPPATKALGNRRCKPA